ncbi:MAG TPA: gas vesicle protein [Thermoanaerobaculia bacterium]|jgi:hypothetical protein|nr:gas vesicle protein [Thermoanaerobaculia bacterium]
MSGSIQPAYSRSTSLVDVLDRVLDKGLVVAGDIRVSLAEVELLTIRIRLLVCSIDKAEEIGLDWWRQDPSLSVGARKLALENEVLREQVRQLEERVTALALASEKQAPAERQPVPSAAPSVPGNSELRRAPSGRVPQSPKRRG